MDFVKSLRFSVHAQKRIELIILYYFFFLFAILSREKSQHNSRTSHIRLSANEEAREKGLSQNAVS